MDASAQPFGFGNQQVSRDQKRRRTLTSYTPVGAAIKKGPLPPPPTPPPDVRQISRNERLILELAVSSINNMAVGGVLLNPLNVVRARLQVQSTIAPNTYNSIGHCLSTVAKEDGIRRLWLYGMRMSCFREFSYGGAQWGLKSRTLLKMASGLSAGAVASAFITPVDIVMIRQFVEGGRISSSTGLLTTGLLKGRKPKCANAFEAFQTIVRTEGWAGVYRGWEPTVVRAAFITMGLTVSYDTTKETLCARQVMEEGAPLHIIASIVSGVTASILCGEARPA
eukprot:gene1157-12045_t